MPEKLDFTIKPLTPIFTGGVEGKCDRLHETGLIGSLRWWFEALMRGVGGYACDPTTHECKDGGYCDACIIFGTTGLKRAFKLEMECCKNRDYSKQLSAIRVVDKYDVNTPRGPIKKNHRGWYLKPGITSDLTGIIYYPLRLLPDGLTNKHFEQIFILTFNLASQWGGLGAGTSKGFGVCDWISPSDLNLKCALEGLTKLINREERLVTASTNYPVLNEFFFTKIQFDPGRPEHFLTDPIFKRIYSPSNSKRLSYYTSKSIIPISPTVRYHMRQLIRDAFPENKVLRHRLMGEVQKQNRQKSLINVSHAYAVPEEENKYEFRIWGWIPQHLYGDVQRKTVIELLQQWTASNGELWKRCSMETDSSYDVWFDMLVGNIEENIKSLIAVRGGENK